MKTNSFNKQSVLLALLFSLLLTACEFRCSVGGDSGTTGKPNAKKGPMLYNNIALNTTGGVKVHRAFLTNDKNERIAEGNFIEPNKYTYLKVIIDSGWTETNGRCYLGASQKITTDGGKVLLDEPDLFESLGVDGASAEDAKIISLSVILKVPPNAPPSGFNVEYRIWDKKGEGSISGQYKIFTK
ncbi:MAG: hypothetical protein JNM68_02840 [Dinghuibacter sp.]|nr:hypothetical protein [Dinghuibacter sp.]